MGETYIKPPLFNLAESYKQSDSHKPLIFVLSPGADPRMEITTQAQAESKFGDDSFKQLSLGQG